AGPANPELAGIINVHAFIEQHLEDGTALGDEELLAGARELDREAAFARRGRLLLGREILDVDLPARPIFRRRLEGAEHWGGAAAVEVGVLGRRTDDAGNIEHAARVLIVEMKAHLAHALELVQEGHVAARAATIVERKGSLERREPLHHAPDRRDADAAGQQNRVRGVLPKREVVARRAGLERPAKPQLGMDVTRAA